MLISTSCLQSSSRFFIEYFTIKKFVSFLSDSLFNFLHFKKPSQFPLLKWVTQYERRTPYKDETLQ